MHDHVESFAMKKRTHGVAVAQIDVMNLNSIRHGRDVRRVLSADRKSR